MTKEQRDVEEFMRKAGQSVALKPCIPDAATRILRIKIMMEELLETAEAAGVKILIKEDGVDDIALSQDDIVFKNLGDDKVDIVGVADGLGDSNFVNYGMASAFGIDLEPVHDEIQRSNMSKFIDGHRREDGKWIKGPSYTPADLKSVIEKQSK